MPKDNFFKFFQSKLSNISGLVSDLRKEIPGELKSQHLNEIDDTIETTKKEMKAFENDVWYLEERKASENKNMLISLMPTVIGTVIIAMIFFWHYSPTRGEYIRSVQVIVLQDSVIQGQKVLFKQIVTDIKHFEQSIGADDTSFRYRGLDVKNVLNSISFSIKKDRISMAAFYKEIKQLQQQQ